MYIRMSIENIYLGVLFYGQKNTGIFFKQKYFEYFSNKKKDIWLKKTPMSP